jgi:hypothetical protein
MNKFVKLGLAIGSVACISYVVLTVFPKSREIFPSWANLRSDVQNSTPSRASVGKESGAGGSESRIQINQSVSKEPIRSSSSDKGFTTPQEPERRVQTEYLLGHSFGRAVDSNDPKEALAAMKVSLFCSLNSNPGTKSFDEWFSWWTTVYGSALRADPRVVNADSRRASRESSAREIYDRCSDFFGRNTNGDAQKFQKISAVKELVAISSEIRDRGASRLGQSHAAFGSGSPAVYDHLMTFALDTLGFPANGNEWADAATRQLIRARVLCDAGEFCSASGFLALETCLQLAVCGQQRVDDELVVALSQAKIDARKFDPLVLLLNAWVRGEIPWSELQNKASVINASTKG